MNFRGINNLTLDAKGRMAVPSRYRERLLEICGGRIVITVDRDHCLLVYPLPEWEIIENKLVSLPSLNKQAHYSVC
jgi:MraZ protein